MADGGGDDEVLVVGVRGERMAATASASARAATEQLGFTAADVDRVESLVERLCHSVCRTDFDDPATASFELAVHDHPEALAIRVADHGLPLVLAGATGHALSAELLADGLADRVEIVSDGDGNVITAELRRDPRALTHLVDHDTPTEESHAEVAPRIERLRREHLESLARCTWRAYGHTYVANFLYHPEQTWRMVEDGRLHSIVALDEHDEVIGHFGVELERRGDRVGDATLALTDPRHRGHHVLASTGAELPGLLEELDLVGTFVEAVTPHTITQRFAVESGAVETGVLLGFIPSSMEYRGFPPEVQGSSRQSAVLGYHPRDRGGSRTLHVPEAYRELVAERYEAMGLDRDFADPGPARDLTRLDVATDGPRALATVEVAAVGEDAADVIDAHRRAACASGTEVVYAELPLEDPATPSAVERLRERGFFYAGFVPQLRGTDVLRLQYLDVDVDTSIIQLYTDDARRLLAFELADRS